MVWDRFLCLQQETHGLGFIIKNLCVIWGSLRSQWVPWLFSCLQTPLLSSRMNSWKLSMHHTYESVDWPVTPGTVTQVMMNMSFSFSKTTLVTIWLWAVWSYGFLSFNPVNPCCLILWRNILVIFERTESQRMLYAITAYCI